MIELATKQTLPSGGSSSGTNAEPLRHCFEFVTIAFDKPQTTLHLPQWRWPLIGPHNGFTGGHRIRGWQLMRFYQANGWMSSPDVCSVTGQLGGTQLHNEDYARPWDAFPVSKRAHTLIHTRGRFPKAWAQFLANEALPETWAKTLSPKNDTVFADADCTVHRLLELAPHPDWVVVPCEEFESR